MRAEGKGQRKKQGQGRRAVERRADQGRAGQGSQAKGRFEVRATVLKLGLRF